MASRFGPSSLSHRDARSSLFDNYKGDRQRPSQSQSPARGVGYGYSGANGYAGNGVVGGGSERSSSGSGADGAGGFRPATPNSRGQYSDSVLSELESQNDAQVEGMTAKVKMLKELTVAIGDEIRTSSALTDKMNDAFDNTRVKLRGTMNRMLRMAEKTGVGWRVWLGFFCAVIFIFWYVWLF